MKRVTEITVKEFKELGKYLPDPEKHGAPFDLKVTKTTRIGPMVEKTETKMYRFKPNTPRLGVKGNWIGWFFSGRVTDYNKPGLEPLYALGICKIEDTVITQEKPAPLTIGTLKEGQYAQSVDNPTFFYRRDKGVVEYFDIAPDSINGLKWTRSINCTPFNLKPIWFGKVKDIPEGMVCRCADLRELVGKYRRKGGDIQYYDSCGDWSWSGVNSGGPNKDDLVFKIGKVEPEPLGMRVGPFGEPVKPLWGGTVYELSAHPRKVAEDAETGWMYTWEDGTLRYLDPKWLKGWRVAIAASDTLRLCVKEIAERP